MEDINCTNISSQFVTRPSQCQSSPQTEDKELIRETKIYWPHTSYNILTPSLELGELDLRIILNDLNNIFFDLIRIYHPRRLLLYTS